MLEAAGGEFFLSRGVCDGDGDDGNDGDVSLSRMRPGLLWRRREAAGVRSQWQCCADVLYDGNGDDGNDGHGTDGNVSCLG